MLIRNTTWHDVDTDDGRVLPPTPTVTLDVPDSVRLRALIAAGQVAVADGTTLAATTPPAAPGPDQLYAPMPLASQPALTPWWQAVSSADLARVNVVLVGSSTTAGLMSTAQPRRWVDRLTRWLQAQFNPAAAPGGTYYRPFEAGASTGTVGTLFAGLGLQALSMSPAATWTFTAAGTGFDVHFAQGPGRGPFTVAVDGAAPVTVTPSTSGAGDRYDGVYSTPAVAAGQHTIVVTAGASAAALDGVYARSGDETVGVRVYNAGCSGANVGGFLTPSHYQRLASLAPSLVVITLGTNDFSSQTPIAAFTAALQQIVASHVSANAAAGAPPPTVLLVGSYQRLDVTNPTIPWSAYLAAMRSVAASSPASMAYLDVGAPFPTANTPAGDPVDVLYVDSIHMTDRGHALFMRLLQHLLAVRPLTAAAAPVPIATPPTDPLLVGGLVGRFQASDLVAAGLTDGSAVPSWPAGAGSAEGLPAAQAVAAQQPVLKAAQIGAQPGVRFTAGSSHNLDTGAFGTSRTAPLTMVVVNRPTASNAGAYVVAGRQGVSCFLTYNATTGLYSAGNTGDFASQLSAPGAAAAGHVVAVVQNGAASRMYVDSTTPVVGTAGAGNGVEPGLRIGSNSFGNGAFFDGVVSEVLLFARALTQAEVEGVLRYLGQRYAITVT